MVKIGFEYREIARRDMWVSIGYGDKSWGIPLTALKTMLVFWLFCGVCLFAYAVGKQDNNSTTMLTAYLSKGGIKTYDGHSMFCSPEMNQKGDLNWKCINATTITVNASQVD